MEQISDESPQHILLQRCKHTIQDLHQELIHLQINNELLVSQRDTLKKLISEKDQMIYELQSRINSLHNYQKESHNSYQQHNLAERQELLIRYQKVVDENNELRREIEISNRLETEDIGKDRIGDREMDSGLFSNKYMERMVAANYDGEESRSSEVVISVKDMLASDKKILIYLIQQKDKQIQSLTRANTKLCQEKIKLKQYYKTSAKRIIDSEYEIILKDDSASGLSQSSNHKNKLVSSKLLRLGQYGNFQKQSSRSKDGFKRAQNVTPRLRSKKSETTHFKSSTKLGYETPRKIKQQVRVKSPQYYYCRKTS